MIRCVIFLNYSDESDITLINISPNSTPQAIVEDTAQIAIYTGNITGFNITIVNGTNSSTASFSL